MVSEETPQAEFPEGTKVTWTDAYHRRYGVVIHTPDGLAATGKICVRDSAGRLHNLTPKRLAKA